MKTSVDKLIRLYTTDNGILLTAARKALATARMIDINYDLTQADIDAISAELERMSSDAKSLLSEKADGPNLFGEEITQEMRGDRFLRRCRELEQARDDLRALIKFAGLHVPDSWPDL